MPGRKIFSLVRSGGGRLAGGPRPALLQLLEMEAMLQDFILWRAIDSAQTGSFNMVFEPLHRLRLLNKLRLLNHTFLAFVRSLRKGVYGGWHAPSLAREAACARAHFNLTVASIGARLWEERERSRAVWRAARAAQVAACVADHMICAMRVEGSWVEHRHDVGTEREGVEVMYVDTYTPLAHGRRIGCQMDVRRLPDAHRSGTVWGHVDVGDWSLRDACCTCLVPGAGCALHQTHPGAQWNWRVCRPVRRVLVKCTLEGGGVKLRVGTKASRSMFPRDRPVNEPVS